ncbi:MAG TPA: hypothetical protein VH062_19190 [Polyangiaceae bacterium]|jgi:hypothetical protein|nr:hypothetical protein [Polyangiaceae bacterium]
MLTSSRPPAPSEEANDRRRDRTDSPLVALSRCFESARRRAGLGALVLADVSGLVIAGAGPAAVCDELAALGAASAPRPANDTVPCRLDVLSRSLEVRRLRIDGIEVLLCTEGDTDDVEPLAEAVAGCQRILGRRRGMKIEALAERLAAPGDPT